ncbi:hypothetical protein F5Y03DRAFT_402212, partial [Xylaria venustula]
MYYSGIGSESAKSDIFQRWLRTSGVMVATNALGAGIDIPDIRATIHAVAPRRMRDYAQESGRGGRDGKPSTSVVFYMQEASHSGHEEDDRGSRGRGSRGRLLPGVMMPLEPGVAPVRVEISSRLKKRKRRPMPQDRPRLGPAVDVDMQQFLEGLRCRRAVLDEVMDGSVDRIGCGENEVPCDCCCARAGVGESGGDDHGLGIAVEDEESDTASRQTKKRKRVRSTVFVLDDEDKENERVGEGEENNDAVVDMVPEKAEEKKKEEEKREEKEKETRLDPEARPIPVPIPVPVPSHDHEDDNYSDSDTEAILAA